MSGSSEVHQEKVLQKREEVLQKLLKLEELRQKQEEVLQKGEEIRKKREEVLQKRITRLEQTVKYQSQTIRKLKDGVMSYRSYRGLTAIRCNAGTDLIQATNGQAKDAETPKQVGVTGEEKKVQTGKTVITGEVDEEKVPFLKRIEELEKTIRHQTWSMAKLKTECETAEAGRIKAEDELNRDGNL